MNTTAHLPARRRASVARLGAVGVAGVLLLAACGDDDDSADTTAAPAATTAAPAGTTGAPAGTTGAPAATTGAPAATTGAPAATTAAPAATTAAPAGTTAAPSGGEASVATAETDIGTVLVDAGGMTLYAFLPDADAAGEPSCTGECAEAWPPAVVEGDPVVEDGLDAATFTVVEHPEAGPMLKAGDWPLYLFAGDEAPGDTNGQGSGGVWFAVGPDGNVIE